MDESCVSADKTSRIQVEHIQIVNRELGLPTPLLTTPLNYLSGGENDAVKK